MHHFSLRFSFPTSTRLPKHPIRFFLVLAGFREVGVLQMLQSSLGTSSRGMTQSEGPHEPTLCGKNRCPIIIILCIGFFESIQEFPLQAINIVAIPPMSCCLIHGSLSRKGVYAQFQTQRLSSFASIPCAGNGVSAGTPLCTGYVATDYRGFTLDTYLEGSF